MALAVVLLLAAIFAVYANSLHVPYLLDDADSIEKNDTIKSFSTAFFPPRNSGVTVSGRPLLNLTLAVNYRLHGTNALGYHVGNILIHMGAALALFGLVRRTLLLPSLASRFGKHATLLALGVAALWALHPLQTESVTYIIQRAESLVGLCYLFTSYAFVRAVEKPSKLWPAITVVSCFLGMAAKEVMATAPLVLFLYDRTFVSGTFLDSWKRHRGLHIALASSWFLLLVLVISSGGRGTSVGYSVVSWLDYLLTQGPGITTYLAHALFPANLVFDYGAVVEKRPLVLVGGILIVFALLTGAILLLVKKPKVGFLGAWFFMILAPTSSIIPVVTQTLADHRMYLPLAAIVAGVVTLTHQTIKRYCWGVLLIFSLVLGVATVQRNITYKTSISIWEDTVHKVPDNVRALNNLGLFYLAANRLEDAIWCFSRALQFVPDYPVASCNLGRSLIYKETNTTDPRNSQNDFIDGESFGQKSIVDSDRVNDNENIKQGLALIEKAIQADPANSFFIALYGNALLSLKQPEKAILQLKKAAALDPNNRDILFDLANTLARVDRNEEAATHFQTVLRLKPDDVETLTNYGSLLRRMGRLNESISLLQTAVRLRPDVARAHSNLGVALLESGRTKEGIHSLEEALRLYPNLPQARYNLSNALAEAGRTDEAIVHLEALLKIAPPTAELLSNLGVLYARVGRLEDAVEQMKRALALDPNHDAAKENLAKITAYLQKHPVK